MLPNLANLSIDAVFDHVDAERLRADAQARGIDRIFNTECVSCLDAFEEDEEVEVFRCGHAMHLRCAQRWYQQPGKEPVCFLCKTHVLTPVERTEVGMPQPAPPPEIVQAARNGNLPRVQELLAAGADVNQVDDRGFTALMLATDWGHTAIAAALLAAGAEVDKVDYDGMTALIWASWQGHTAIVKALLAAGADANHWDNDGDTALMLASYWGHAEIVKLLLAAGADVNHVSNNGETALMKAEQQNHPAVAALLRAHGATD
jgi:hypothetical protein